MKILFLFATMLFTTSRPFMNPLFCLSLTTFFIRTTCSSNRRRRALTSNYYINQYL